MPRFEYLGTVYECREGETVLDAFLRQGVNVPFSCRNGVCQVCLQRCVRGAVPGAAQAGLRPTLSASGYFLACKCQPSADMVIAPPREADLFSPVVVHSKELLVPDVCRVLLEPATALYYRPGQFINLRRPDGLTRSYSLASLPQEDYFLELHVKRMSGGEMSNWIFDELAVNDELEIQGPQGSAFYAPGSQDERLLMVASGTGLGPLIGIVRDALHRGHRGDIHLYHGSRHASGLYLHKTLLELCGRHQNFHYAGCVSGSEAPAGHMRGRAHEVAFALHSELWDWRIHLAGLPDMVKVAEQFALRAGAHPAQIHADPFEFRDLRRRPREPDEQRRTRTGKPPSRRSLPPDPEMWAALKEGQLLSTILTDFYDRVFADPWLAPYFRGVTKRRLIEKVYSFMCQAFTGDKVYFGDRPRNAHHWMVISEELFDYREELLASCLRRHGLPKHLIRRWRAIEESFRGDIVKATPWKRVVDGIEMPLEGFDDAVLEVGTLCDGCGQEIAQGESVRYHVRLGSTYCSRCTRQTAASG